MGQLILRKVITIIVSRCQILRLKCTKIDFGWGCAPDPAEELVSQHSPRLPSWNKEDLLLRKRKGGRGMKGKGKGSEGRVGE